MVAAVVPANIIVGAAAPYYRALAAISAWLTVGATVDDAAFRINQSWFSPDLNGMLGQVQELDYLTGQGIELEFSMAEIAGSKLALAIPGATATAGSIAETGAGFATTLAAATVIGATNIKVASVTTVTAGMYVGIDVVAGSLREYRQIDTVGTLGAGGTGLTFRDPLKLAHSSGVVVIQTDGDGKTAITGASVRRQPAASYNQWALVAEAPGGYYEALLTSGISSTDAAEISFGEETVGAIRTTIAGRYAGATPNTPPWTLRVPA